VQHGAYGYPPADQIGHEPRQPLKTVLSPAVFNRQVLAYNKAHFPETGLERVDRVLSPSSLDCAQKSAAEVPDHRHRLLRLRGERETIHVLHFRDGKHASFNLMFDRLMMLEQLGLIPTPAVAG
jgi:hypothetical protein